MSDAPSFDVIATRDFTVAHDPATRCTVQLGRPERQPTGEWSCPFRITGQVSHVVRHAYGEDSMQALQLAVDAIGMALRELPADVAWAGCEALGTGFPGSIPVLLPVEYQERARALVDAVVMEWAAAVSKDER